MADQPTGVHHVAYACRDIEETTRFYEDVIGFPLVHVVVDDNEDGGFMRHAFFDTGDGTCLAFFDLHGFGEKPDWTPEVSRVNGLPLWVTHIAFRASEERQTEVKGRLAGAGLAPLMEVDHGWCHSLYIKDPNGIMIELCRDTPGLHADRDLARSRLGSSKRTEPPARIIRPEDETP
jgi:catechol 2,3-dioxygenase-like lactoylglutathione lyase family enzyme